MSKQQEKKKESEAYLAGLDCARNGANTTNCHFTHFATPEQTREWERGKRDGELVEYAPEGGGA